MKTILLSLPYGMSARNMLRSEVYSTLKNNVSLLIVTPLANDPDFVSEFAGPNVNLALPPQSNSLAVRFFERVFFPLELYRFTRKNPIESLMLLKSQARKNTPFRFYLTALASETVGRLSFVLDWIEKRYYGALRSPAAEALMRKHNVSIVFLTHGYVRGEAALAVTAKSLGLPVINMVHSWDNLTTKSGLAQITSADLGRVYPIGFFDNIIVWNEVLKQELAQLYGYPGEKVFLSGIPQFDAYPKIPTMAPKNVYLKSLGADPDKKTILYIGCSPSINRDQTAAVNDLVKAVRSGHFSVPTQLIIRFHPGAPINKWVDLFKGPEVFFHHPSHADRALPVSTGWDKTPDGVSELAKAICHSDVVVNCASTTSIEAAIFDKPNVGLAYDGQADHSPAVLQQYFQTTHYSKLMKMEGIRLAKDPQQLIDVINQYLKNPELDSAGRQKIREQQCYKLDGQAGKRIAAFLIAKAAL